MRCGWELPHHTTKGVVTLRGVGEVRGTHSRPVNASNFKQMPWPSEAKFKTMLHAVLDPMPVCQYVVSILCGGTPTTPRPHLGPLAVQLISPAIVLFVFWVRRL